MEGRGHGDPRHAGDRLAAQPPAAPLDRLSSDELEEELTIAAYAPGRQRIAYFERLLAERRRRLIAA